MKKDIETINKIKEEMNSTISEMKHTLEGIKSRLHEAEDQIRAGTCLFTQLGHLADLWGGKSEQLTES